NQQQGKVGRQGGHKLGGGKQGQAVDNYPLAAEAVGNAAKHRAEHHQAQVVEQDDQRRNVLVDAKVPGDGGHGGGLEGRRFNGDKEADQQGYKYRPRIGYGCLGGGAVGEGYGHGTPYGYFWLFSVPTGGCGRQVISNAGAQRLPGL